MPYTHFRYIAYEVPTATSKQGVEGVKSGFPAGKSIDGPVDVTVPPDAQTRVRRLAAVVDRAATHVRSRYGDGADTLKVFIAPEFYFRPPDRGESPGKEGLQSFPHETYPQDHAYAIIEALNKMFVHASFEHWLIVAGTVMWNFDDQVGPLQYRNSAMYVRGHAANDLRVIEKAVASGIDGVPNPYKASDISDEKYDPSLDKLFEDWFHRKRRVFDVAGVTCGLEVCLDHGGGDTHRILKTALSEWQFNEGQYPPGVKLQLLTAGGMRIQPGSVAAVEGGYLLRNDGYSNFPHSELRKIVGYEKPIQLKGRSLQQTEPTYSWDLQGSAKLSDSIMPWGRIPLDGSFLVPMFENGYFEFPQQIVFYPRLPLP